MDIEALKLTVAIDRFSQLISSTQPQPLRLASTSSRYIPTATAAACIVEEAFLADVFSALSPLLDHSSWTSSALAASQSLPFSHMPKPLSSAPAARQFSANQQVVRRD
jgi:hypothetical protein